VVVGRPIAEAEVSRLFSSSSLGVVASDERPSRRLTRPRKPRAPSVSR
jgi:hypothetical protein